MKDFQPHGRPCRVRGLFYLSNPLIEMNQLGLERFQVWRENLPATDELPHQSVKLRDKLR